MTQEHAVRLPEVPPAIKQAAMQAGGGWLDEVVGDHHGGGVPVTAIRGAWRLDANGEPTGEYVANPRYQPSSGGGCPFHRGR